MGIHDRPYYRRRVEGGPDPYAGMAYGIRDMSGWSFNTWIIAVNIAVFVIDVLIEPAVGYQPFLYWGHFSTNLAVEHLQVWRFLTFQFLHAGLLHILINMWVLYMFGSEVERHLGSRRYLAFYLLCGMAGAGLYLVLNLLGQFTQAPLLLVNDPRTPLVGASAGIFGVLMAMAWLRPNQIITLFLFFIIPISMRIKTLAYGLVLVALFTLYTGGQNAGGEAGHLGGAAFGALLIRHSKWLNFALLMPLDRWKARGRHAFRRFDSGAGGEGGGGFFRSDPGYRREQDEAEVDRILAKVANEGLHSLTAGERRVLQNATERRRE